MRPTTVPTTRPTPRHALRAIVACVALGLAAGACGSGGATEPRPTAEASPIDSPAATDAPAPEPRPTTAPPSDPAPESAPEPKILVARSTEPEAVFEHPGDPEPARILPGSTDFGSPLTLLVTDVGAGATDGWLRVLLPGRPNGAEAWLRAADVELYSVRHEVRVDLAARTLQVVEDGEVLLMTPIAVGEPANPTPTGRFSITDKLETGDAASPYGPFALGLSGRSEVLTEFAGGDGQVGIHGTDDPASIGQAASHGCIRVPNDVIEQLAAILPLGTPVTVA
jgi:hypothetical protein